MVPVLNAADETKVPGGSSGGSAVAAGRSVHGQPGTDTGGSIRQPASLMTGTVGFKPTWSHQPVRTYSLRFFFDQRGTFTRNAVDAAMLTEVMAGQDPHDATSSSQPVPDYAALLEPPAKLRIAWYPQTIDNGKLDPEVKQQFHDLLENLKAAGHTVESVDFTYLDYLVPTYYVLTNRRSIV